MFHITSHMLWQQSNSIRRITSRNPSKRNPSVLYTHAAITTPEVYNQNSNEQPKFCFTPEEFNKLMALANSTQSASSNQNNLQPAVTLSPPLIFPVTWDLHLNQFFLHAILLLISQILIYIDTWHRCNRSYDLFTTFIPFYP